MEKLNMHTVDMADENLKRLSQLFPNCLTEKLDENGRPQMAIDFDRLKQELSSVAVEGSEERYQFTWPGKRDAIRLANAPTNMTLRPSREESVDFDSTQNLYIEGDNLEVLKILRENYLGKVKMIYIDPPYNTGNDFVYEDDFAEDSASFQSHAGMFDSDGNMLLQNYEKNSESNGRFHTDWLNMIYPRLKVARDLLSEDGVIFISIDDNEVENLKKVGNEIFGAANYVGELIWQTATDNNPRQITIEHEYVLCYAKASKNLSSWVISSSKAKIIESYYNNNLRGISDFMKAQEMLRKWMKKHEDELQGVMHYNCVDAKGVYTNSTNSSNTKPGGYTFDIIHPITKKACVKPAFGWRWAERTFWEYDKNGDVEWGIDETTQPHIKKRIGTATELLKSIYYEDSRASTKLIEALFGKKKIFDNPKAMGLVRRLIEFSVSQQDSLILDFFSGSATTAHAVMQLNAEDGGHRKFIMVQLPEQTEETSEAYKAGYKNICEIGKERIRRAGKKIREELEAKTKGEGLFADTQEKQTLDTGFRVLKLAESNMEDVYYTPEDSSENTLFANNIKSDRTAEDLLFQVLPECNMPLSSKIETRQIHGKTVFSVNDNYLIACFDDNINEAAITEIAKCKPYYFISRDSSLASDSVADNFLQIFKTYSKDTICRIL